MRNQLWGKRKKRLLGGVVVLTLALGMLWGCATTVPTEILNPARAHEASKLRSMAVMPFNGPGGAQVQSEVEAMMVGIYIKGEPYFQMIERGALQRVMDEQRLSMSGAIDEASATQVGKLAGAQGILMGTTNGGVVNDETFYQDRSKCARKDANGKCVAWQKYRVTCTERTAQFSFTPKVVDVATGRIVASEMLTGTASDRKCRDESASLDSGTELIARARKQAMDRFRTMIAPYPTKMKIKLITKDNTKMSKEVKEAIATGVTFSKEGRMDRACEFWRQAYEMHGQGYALPFLLGMCAELSGDLDESLVWYQEADRNTKKPIRDVSLALERIRVKQANEHKISEAFDE